MFPLVSEAVRQDMSRPRPPASKANRTLSSIPSVVAALRKTVTPARMHLRARWAPAVPVEVAQPVALARLQEVLPQAVAAVALAAVLVEAAADVAVLALLRPADLPRTRLDNKREVTTKAQRGYAA